MMRSSSAGGSAAPVGKRAIAAWQTRLERRRDRRIARLADLLQSLGPVGLEKLALRTGLLSDGARSLKACLGASNLPL